MTKFDEWKENLYPNAREWLKHQPIWRDRDLAVVAAVALFVGFVIGYISKWM